MNVHEAECPWGRHLVTEKVMDLRQMDDHGGGAGKLQSLDLSGGTASVHLLCPRQCAEQFTHIIPYSFPETRTITLSVSPMS